jgi:hypothetical protein
MNHSFSSNHSGSGNGGGGGAGGSGRIPIIQPKRYNPINSGSAASQAKWDMMGARPAHNPLVVNAPDCEILATGQSASRGAAGAGGSVY